jgi:acetyl esterase/lipase
MNILLWSTIAVLVAVGGVAALLLLRPRNPLRFTYATGLLPDANYAALAAKPGWQKWSLRLSDGVVLNGLVRRPTQPDAPWVLFYPGNDPAQLTTGQQAVETIIAGETWGGAVISYRGFDGSGGIPHIDELRRDGLEIFDGLRTAEHLQPAQVHLAAFSIGGNIASHVTSQLAARNTPAASLSLMASVYDIAMIRPSWYARLDAGDDLKTGPDLAGVPAPVLVLQGSADEALVGNVQGKAIAAALGAKAEYIELPGVGHVALLFNADALSQVHRFVAAHLR